MISVASASRIAPFRASSMASLSTSLQRQASPRQPLSTDAGIEKAGKKSSRTELDSELAAARATLADASNVRYDAGAVSANAKKALAEARTASAGLAASIETIESVISKASSFDKQWADFQAKFDQLNKLAVQRMSGMLVGSGSGSGAAAKRPAEMISEQRVAQVLSRASKVVVLTGAGISAESGIPTFRGADGFWTVGSENYRPQELATWEKFNEMPEELWRWYQYRWGICRKAQPNPGHHALVELEGLVRGDFTLVTQNIDGLHLEAGSDRQRLYEIHGRIDEMRCDERIEGACLHGLDLNDPANFAKVKATLVKTPPPAKEEADECLHCCSLCGVRQRPKILWFDESYNEAIYGLQNVKAATQACDVLLIIGTQLTTGLPSTMAGIALSSGATIIKMDTLVDLADERSAGMLHIQAKSGQALPRIISELRKLRQEPALAPLSDSLKIACAAPDLSAVPAVSAEKGGKASTSGLLALTKNSSLAKAKPTVGSMSESSRGPRSNSSAASRKPSSPPAASNARSITSDQRRSSSAVRSKPSLASGTPPPNQSRSRMSGALKAAGSAALLKDPSPGSRPGSRPGSCPGSRPGSGVSTEGFFVYGTLRPDDDSGATWTKSFIEGMDSEVAFLPGASLYIDGSYPAVSLEQTHCSVRGVFLRPTSSSMLSSKLAEADRIEGFPDLYDRIALPVQTASDGTQKAYVYHRTGRTDRAKCTRVPDGDWLSRKR